MLLSPAPIDAPADRRNYRWVARKPDHRTRAQPPGTPPAAARTPRYAQMPRWGLIDSPPQNGAAPRRPLGRLTDSATKLLAATAAVFVLAALAELARYAVLLRNRTRLIHPGVLFASDALVVLAGVFALVFALLAAIGTLGRLIEIRQAVYAEAGQRDPRSPRVLAFGCLVPVVNLLWPGIFLTEVAALRGDPRSRRAIRIWWAAWVVGGGVALAALLWRNADSLQVKADGVLFTAFADAIAAVVALLTLWVLRTIDGRDLLGRSRSARRWLIAVDPAVPVIEPVHPGGTADSAPQTTAAPAHENNGAGDREQEEVMAK
ncbi:DUF4328 domain-containing protein [Nocardia sp. NBC_00508]|uniref:DUF4328 domain-containing protein n=1 Tax=Nocardia sp. NBC_00508 TaxID=2975992 RepID=UPI002E800535|nr:DUF4328 domain-containing protein [Nocardia sp. NBC_00508]WUD69511.1 DUF4328 domain-containing protein [Nocardia sp. NBC_00508]